MNHQVGSWLHPWVLELPALQLGPDSGCSATGRKSRRDVGDTETLAVGADDLSRCTSGGSEKRGTPSYPFFDGIFHDINQVGVRGHGNPTWGTWPVSGFRMKLFGRSMAIKSVGSWLQTGSWTSVGIERLFEIRIEDSATSCTLVKLRVLGSDCRCKPSNVGPSNVGKTTINHLQISP